jgi:RNA polymerase sigma factor (sigma-70 family)
LHFRAALRTFFLVSFESSPIDDDGEQMRKAQQGDPDALTVLRHQCHPALVNILLARGANQTEVEDILADIWSDCVPGAADKPSLLARFGGKYSILSWLARVAANRWIDLKRRAMKHADREETRLDDLPGYPAGLEDDSLLDLLRESLRTAFDRCSGGAMVMLRLVYVHGLTQREVGHMFGWSESKVSRALSRAMEQIKMRTLQELKRHDARLELCWEDFLGLCDADDTDFL